MYHLNKYSSFYAATSLPAFFLYFPEKKKKKKLIKRPIPILGSHNNFLFL